ADLRQVLPRRSAVEPRDRRHRARALHLPRAAAANAGARLGRVRRGLRLDVLRRPAARGTGHGRAHAHLGNGLGRTIGDMAAPIRIGTCSWADESLSRYWYPPSVKGAEERLRYYTDRFDTVEANSTYYHLPAREIVE